MADVVTKVEHYSIDIEDKVGEGFRVLETVRDGGVNLIGFWGYPMEPGRARLEMVPESGAALKKAIKKAALTCSDKQTAFHITGRDRPGAVAAVLAKLAAAGINVHAVQAACAGPSRFGALIYVKPEDVRNAAKALGA